MPWAKPKWRPGINKTDTLLANEGGFSDGNRVRTYQGQFQPIGGWIVETPTTFDGYARGAHSWTNLEGQPCKAWGTESKLYGEVQNARKDITPQLHFTVLNNCFTTVNLSPIVTVTVPFHNLIAGNSVTFSNHQSTVGGLTIEGTYTVLDVLSDSQFRITHGSNASSTVSTPGGGFVDFTAPLPVGLTSNPLTGYGSGSYGSGPYGGALNASELRVWSLGNFGENLMANPAGYGLFEWQPEVSYPELAVNGDFASSTGWALGTNWSIGAGVATKTVGTAANLSQSVIGLNLDGRTCIVTFTVTRSAGSLKLRINAGAVPAVIDVGEASSAITKSGTYTRIFRMPADASDIVFEADAAFGGTVDNVSYKLYDKAYRITTAPARIDAMFVSAKDVVVLLGCVNVLGDYDPNCIRNCDVGNNRLWIPDTNNVAGEVRARSIGGRLMAGTTTREQEGVWGDAGFGVLTWVGEAGGAYKFDFVAEGCGLISRHAFAECSGFLIWASNARKFFIFRGIGATSKGVVEEIPCPIREDVFNNLDFRQSLKCHAGVNPEWTEFWFFWPDSRDVVAPTPSECSRYALFNWIDGTWAPGQMARTAWISSGILPYPIGFEPYAANTGLVYQHEVGKTANGALLGAWLKTSSLDMEDGENLATLKAIAPDFRDQSGNITVTVEGRRFAYSNPITYGPYTLAPTSQRVPTRVMARQIALRFDWITTDGFGRLGATSFDIDKTGARR